MIANENATKGEEWFPVTSDELQAYFALCIIMSQVKKSSIDMGLVKPSCCSNTNILKTYAPQAVSSYISLSTFYGQQNDE